MIFFNYLHLLQKPGLASANLKWTPGGMQIVVGVASGKHTVEALLSTEADYALAILKEPLPGVTAAYIQ